MKDTLKQDDNFNPNNWQLDEDLFIVSLRPDKPKFPRIGYAPEWLCQKDFEHTDCDYLFNECSCGIEFLRIENGRAIPIGFFKYKKIHNRAK